MPRIIPNLRPSATFGLIPIVGLISVVGCAGQQHLTVPSAKPTVASLAPSIGNPSSDEDRASHTNGPSAEPSDQTEVVRQVGHSAGTSPHSFVAFQNGTGPNEIGQNEIDVSIAVQEAPPIPLPVEEGAVVGDGRSNTDQLPSSTDNSVELNLPTALAMVGGQHPAVGFARWRVQEAYAQLAAAEVLWLPSIQAGFSFRRHDGNYQAVDGNIVDVNLNSFQYGLGTGAIGAGTTARPGLIAQFHLADAIFQPKVAEKAAWARGHAAATVLNQQLLTAATAYIELLDAYQDARILEESRERTAELSKITGDFAEAGEGLQADADRMQTELSLIDTRLLSAHERIAVASARLAQAISLDSNSQILTMDTIAVPLDLIALGSDRASLISMGLSTRPELKESQALVAAACEAYKREKYAPFVPSVLLGFSTGGFGGGLGNDLSNVDNRYDFDALMSWQVRNLGMGEQAARRATTARIQQARFEQLRVMDQVALDITESYSQVEFRRQQIEVSQKAIASAANSYTRNLERIRNAQGLPIEVLQSVQALETARRAYLNAVISYNQAQFRLQWALGWPVSAPANSVAGN